MTIGAYEIEDRELKRVSIATEYRRLTAGLQTGKSYVLAIGAPVTKWAVELCADSKSTVEKAHDIWDDYNGSAVGVVYRNEDKLLFLLRRFEKRYHEDGFLVASPVLEFVEVTK